MLQFITSTRVTMVAMVLMAGFLWVTTDPSSMIWRMKRRRNMNSTMNWSLKMLLIIWITMARMCVLTSNTFCDKKFIFSSSYECSTPCCYHAWHWDHRSTWDKLSCTGSSGQCLVEKSDHQRYTSCDHVFPGVPWYDLSYHS